MSDDVTIRVAKNGPYTIIGAVELVGPDGEPWTDLPEGKPLALCRCGRSATKPFCDGTHNREGFASEPTAEGQPYPW